MMGYFDILTEAGGNDAIMTSAITKAGNEIT